MEIGNYVMIAPERYEQLIRAEHDANQLKSFIAECHENYHIVSREELNLLYTMYIGNKEVTK